MKDGRDCERGWCGKMARVVCFACAAMKINKFSVVCFEKCASALFVQVGVQDHHPKSQAQLVIVTRDVQKSGFHTAGNIKSMSEHVKHILRVDGASQIPFRESK